MLCHLCGRALAMLAGSHLAGHGWPPALYREAFGLMRTLPLLAPELVERRRMEGARRYAANPRLREGMATGQAMARDGRLLALSHAAQPAGTARLQARQGAARRAEPVR